MSKETTRIIPLGVRIFHMGEEFGVAVDPNSLTSAELREAITNYGHHLVRRLDGKLTMFDPEDTWFNTEEEEKAELEAEAEADRYWSQLPLEEQKKREDWVILKRPAIELHKRGES
jgi:hypothetical protein